jgi:hypothetical protein
MWSGSYQKKIGDLFLPELLVASAWTCEASGGLRMELSINAVEVT